jgi:hypothetical protein
VIPKRLPFLIFCSDVYEHSVFSISIGRENKCCKDGTECSETSSHKIKKCRRWGITQKKENSIQNKAKVLNKKNCMCFDKIYNQISGGH